MADFGYCTACGEITTVTTACCRNWGVVFEGATVYPPFPQDADHGPGEDPS